MNLELCIRVGGVLQLGILVASSLVPKVLGWRSQLRPLDPLLRHVVWVHGAYIVLTIAGLGILSVTGAAALVDGSFLARSVTGFIAIFWLGRLVLQFVLFDAKPYLTNRFLWLGYHGLTITFTYLAVIFSLVAFR